MSSDDPEHSTSEPELAPIEFTSPGLFSFANPSDDLPRRAGQSRALSGADVMTGVRHFETASEARQHLLDLFGQARRSVSLYSPDFEPWLYSHRSVQQVCTRFLLDNPRNRLRVLLKDSSRAVKQGHQLVSLARRLSSGMQIRKTHPEYPAHPDVFLVVDDYAVLVRPKPSEFEGYVRYGDPGRARQLQRQFDAAWEHSLSDPDLRSFLL